MQDTVGAGDCFVGTFAYLLNQALTTTTMSVHTLSMDEIAHLVQQSCFASSYSVQFKGGFEKYPSEIMNTWKEL